MAAHTSASSTVVMPPITPAPGTILSLQVARRNGSLSPFDPAKISVAISKAFVAVEGTGATASRRIHDAVESMTAQIVNAIEKGLKPRGVAVMIEAEHSCMAMRGIKKQGASTVTTQFTGVFKEEREEQMRFFTLLRGAK